jgi:hypothetical protein
MSNVQVFVNIKEGGLRTDIKEVKNIDFELFPITLADTPSFRGKPMEGGLWTTDEGHSWVNHCLNNLSNNPSLVEKLPSDKDYWEFFTLNVLPEAKVYTINSKKDYDQLLQEFLLENFLSFNYLDWEKISHKYDALRLTEKGLEETRSLLYGWEIPQTLWFRWKFQPPGSPLKVPFEIPNS